MQEKSFYKLLFALFAISGFCGLIYESIWSHYLKLFLGHAAYAQTLVLAIFMGGMALGSWICSKYSSNWKNLLLGYAIAEGAIGIAALLFHNIFDASIQVAYNVIIPNVGSVFLAHFLKWLLASLLILPQSILLGMTFPLMSAGIIRRFPRHPGGSVSMLYFSNSMGAAVGVLSSGFLLIGAIGLPGTIITAGIINIALAVIVWLLVKNDRYYEYAPEFDIPTERLPPQTNQQWFYLFLAVALLTGAASFIYEIAWIRMLALVLGSSTHAFELMLSAFIFGLAMGGLWIKSRIDHIKNVVVFLAIVQLIMGILALSTLPLYNYTFNVMQWLFNHLDKTELGYALYNLSSHAIALIIMVPTTFCAGMTLPIITFTLLKYRHGEKSIGAVYAFNTLGAIIGIFFAVHIGMPYLGLKGLLCMGAAIDIAIAITLVFIAQPKAQTKAQPKAQSKNKLKITKAFVITNLAGVCALILTILLVELDPYKMSSAVYRHGMLTTADEVEILYHKDGKTTTVDLQKTGGRINIRTNGKVDANLNMSDQGEMTLDEPTMVLSAILPLTFNPIAKNAAVIGIGSGLTSHTLLAMPTIERVDTIEIEAAMAEAAQGFRPRVERTFSDLRSHIHIEDAKTYFSIQNKQYDIIVSEPSNPWVSGISSLFSREFYRTIPRYLSDTGVFTQWVQLYELNMDLVASIIKALSGTFDDYAIYLASNRDILIVAKKHGQLALPSEDVMRLAPIAAELTRIKIKNIDDINIRRIGSKRVLDPFFSSYDIDFNSDYYPVLDIGAAKARYLNSDAGALAAMSYANLPVTLLMDPYSNTGKQTIVTESRSPVKALFTTIGISVKDYYMQGTVNGTPLPIKYQNTVDHINRIFKQCEPTNIAASINSLLDFSSGLLAFLTTAELNSIWQDLQADTCFENLLPQQQDWISLLHAISQRQGAQIAGLASWLLTNSVAETNEQYEFLISAAMLGEILANQPEKARAIWATYRHKIDSDSTNNLQIRVLLAHLNGR